MNLKKERSHLQALQAKILAFTVPKNVLRGHLVSVLGKSIVKFHLKVAQKVSL